MPLIKESGVLMYKCRMCDKQFVAFHVPDAMAASLVIMKDMPYKTDDNGMSAGPTTLHNCHANGLRTGIADFVGTVQDIDDDDERIF